MPNDKLLGLLKGLGLNDNQAHNLVLKAELAGKTNKERERQQVELDAKKAEIITSLSEIAKSIPNFNVEVRNGDIQVRLGGTSVTGRPYTAPTATPIKDAGGARNIVSVWGSPDDKADFAKADVDKDGTKKWQIATRVYKANQADILTPKA